MGPRVATVARDTLETQIEVTLNLDGTGQGRLRSSVAFLDHMLDQVVRHGLVDLDIRARGDLEIDAHHTVEDIGITLGQALSSALADRGGIERYGSALVPMDECLVQVALDLSGRAHLALDVPLSAEVIGGMETEAVGEFLRGLVNHAGITLHVRLLEGSNTHHAIEGVFKALARALRTAVAVNPRERGVPSTKGSL